MLNIIREDERDAFEDMLTAVAMVIVIESRNGMASIPNMNVSMCNAVAPALGAAVGQIILDELIEATAHMDRETLVRWFGEIMTKMLVDLLNKEPGYRDCIEKLIEELP